MSEWVEFASLMVEAAGVVTILIGGLVAAAMVVHRARHRPQEWYHRFRRYFGRAILLGLEFLVAADIMRTVSHVPSFENVAVLGLIVLIRTFLSFTIEVELEGYWPWKRAAHEAHHEGPRTGP